MSDKCNQKIDEPTMDSKNGFSVKVESILQLYLLSENEKFGSFSCETTFPNFFNETKGVIYLQKCKFNEEFKRTLKEAYQLFENAIKRVLSSRRTLTLRQYSLPSTCKNNHILSISPDNHQIPLCTSIKTGP